MNDRNPRPPVRRRGRVTALALALTAGAGLIGGCSGSDETPAGTASSPTGGGTVTVLAAASLKESFTQIKKDFEQSHPGTTITLAFGASSALQEQIVQGAPADVFASASTATMDALVKAGLVAAPVPFASNRLRIAVPPSNPAGVTTLADLAKPDVKVAVCASSVPCGKVAAAVLANARLTVTPVTEEADVKATLAKVQLGEVDAGLVYVTDVLAAGDKVKGIPIDDAVNASTTYPIGVVKGADAPAQAFVDFVTGEQGRAVLLKAGFAAP